MGPVGLAARDTMREEHRKLPKVVVLLGPTASGKTTWALQLAKKHSGEVVSADSRQIYKKMNIGTAKPPGENKRNGLRRSYVVEEVPHHLVDFLDPGRTFSVAEFRDQAVKIIKMTHKNGHLPLVVGGTGLYISSLVDNLVIPRVPPNKKFRRSLSEKTNKELLRLLEQMDPETARTIDARNKRRLIRALEVCTFTGEPYSAQREVGEPLFDFLQIGIDTPREVLYERINTRVDEMMKLGLLKEVEGLAKNYIWELSSMNGIGYRQFRDYFDGSMTLDQAIERLKRDTRRYARRQLSWFRRDKRIRWVSSYEEAAGLVEDFLAS